MACEYDIKHLIEISEEAQLDNVHKMLQYAHAHSPRLKTACLEFIKKNISECNAGEESE